MYISHDWGHSAYNSLELHPFDYWQDKKINNDIFISHPANNAIKRDLTKGFNFDVIQATNIFGIGKEGLIKQKQTREYIALYFVIPI